MYDELHSHSFEGKTSKKASHYHDYSGTTTKNPDFDGHAHYMSGYTGEEAQHAHYYSLMTGPDIEVEGGHLHFYQYITTIDNRHYHFIYGYTSIHTEY